MKKSTKKSAVKTSLPPSLKKSASKATNPPVVKKAPEIRINLEQLLNIRERATLHPEEITIGRFGMSEKTRTAVLNHLGINIAEYDGYLYGYRVFLSERLEFGKIQVCAPDAEILNTLTVIEG